MSNKSLPAAQVAIIGAGIAGLSAAYELKKAGVRVEVFEKNPSEGGRMKTDVREGLQFNSGATLLSDNYYQLKQYAHELGIQLTPMVSGSSHRVVRGGQSFTYRVRGPLGILSLPMISVVTRWRLLIWLVVHGWRRWPSHFFDLSSESVSITHQSASEYLRRAVGDEVVDYLLDPFIAALHFYGSDQLSFNVVAAMVTVMSRQGNFSARHPVGGMEAVVKALAKQVTVHYRAAVNSVTGGSKQSTLLIKGKKQRYDAIVLACPAPVTLGLLAKPTATQQKLLNAISYAPTITVSFRVPANLFADGTHCIYVPYIENQTISCCMFEGSKGEELIHRRQTLLNIYLHAAQAKALMDLSDQQVASTVLKELGTICPEVVSRLNEVSFHQLKRWPLAMPTFTYQSVAAVSDFLHHHQGEDGLYLAGDYLNAPWTEGAAQSGVRAARLVAAKLQA